MKNKSIWIGLMVSLIAFVAVSSARADEWDKKTVLTFSQPVEIPGHVLPAGTYMFKLADTMGDRRIVQVFNADGSEIIATVMAISDNRLTSTDETVVKFSEVPAGSPEAIRAWFYPGNTIGQAFVYPKSRATQLARASKAVVPALAVDVAGVDDLKTVPIVAVTPDEADTAVPEAIQTTPVANSSSTVVGTTGIKQTGTSSTRKNARHLPNTASVLPLIVFIGIGAIGAGFSLMMFGKRASSPAV
jgi:hypothetical protein